MNPVTSNTSLNAMSETLPNGEKAAWQIAEELANKPWAESTTDEKLEKIKMVLEGLNTNSGYVSESISKLQTSVHQLYQHSHDNGKVVIPIDRASARGVGLVGLSSSRKNPLS